MKFFVFLFIVINPSIQFCEGQNLKLITALQKADSIILISHKITDGYVVRVPGDIRKDLPLIIDHNINPAVIVKKSRVDSKEKIRLANIFKTPIHLREYTIANCDEPHNSILIYARGTLSYVDVCFTCRHAHLSKKFYSGDSDELILIQKQWTLLENFFNKFHLAYKGFE